MSGARALLIAATVYDGSKRGGKWLSAQTAAAEAEELAQLASAAGLDGLAMQTLRVRAAHPATFFGEGGVDKIAQLAGEVRADVIVVNRDLNAVQARNLEQAWGRAVLDRSGLILDIFASRARTHESKTQVELARSERHLSRLAGLWSHLERQRGGIGVRGGPGEKQIELDRRLTGEKIRRLRARIERLQARGDMARKRRRKNGVLSVALTGYTNAGKSTLFNRLTRAGAPANGRMFDTLELKSRRMFMGGGDGNSNDNNGNGGENLRARSAVVSDTVGFIRDLPHELVSGFAATLRDATDSDLLLVVVDAADDEWRERLEVVTATLARIGAGEVPRLLVMNKSDAANAAAAEFEMPAAAAGEPPVWISAKTGAGMPDLRRRLLARLGEMRAG